MNTGARKKNLKIIVCAAVITAALLAAVWLVLGRTGTVYNGVTPPVKVLSVDGGDLFDVSPLGAKVSSHSVGVYLDVRSRAEGRYFTLGEAFWTNGVCSSETRSDRLGYAERFVNGSWEYCCDVAEIGGRSLMDKREALRLIRPSGEDAETAAARIPIDEPGRYRVFLEARDYFPACGGDAFDLRGSSGDVSYTLGFEYTVGEADAEQPQIAAVEIQPVPSSENAAYLNFAVRCGRDVSALTIENISIERTGIFGGCSADAGTGGAKVLSVAGDVPGGLSAEAVSVPEGGGSEQIFCVWGYTIADVEPDAVYRLSVELTEKTPAGDVGRTVRFLVRTPE